MENAVAAPFKKGDLISWVSSPNFNFEVSECKFIKNPREGIDPYWRVYASGSGKTVEGKAEAFKKL